MPVESRPMGRSVKQEDNFDLVCRDMCMFIGTEFKHGVQTLRAKINDKDWLQAFQNRQVDVRPGDALKVKLESVVNYDFKNEVASTTYTVVNVEEVIIATEPDQSSLEF